MSPQESLLEKKNKRTLKNTDKPTEYQNGEAKSDTGFFHQINLDRTIVVGGD